MDLFVNDVGDISAGNMRNRAQESANRAVDEHNQILAGQITQLHKNLQDQKSAIMENETLKDVQDGVQAFMGAGAVRNALKNYQEASAKGMTKADALSSAMRQGAEEKRVGQGVEGEVERTANPLSTDKPSASATPEGQSATGSSSTAPTVEDHESLTVGEGGEGGMLKKGMANTLGISEELSGKVMRGVGAAGSAAQGGYDLYQDIKAGHVVGSNGWEKAGNITQIGASALDMIGVAFPPAEIVGGVSSVVGGGLDAVGEMFEGKKKTKDTEEQEKATEQKEEQEKEVQVPVSQAPQVAQAQVQ